MRQVNMAWTGPDRVVNAFIRHALVFRFYCFISLFYLFSWWKPHVISSPSVLLFLVLHRLIHKC
jgi:hypothetical protein